MQTTRFTQLPGMTLAIMLTLLVGQGLVFGNNDREGSDHSTLTGTWHVNVTHIDCQTRQPVPPGTPVSSLNTFLEDGSLLASPAIATTHTGHGRWEPTGDHTFEAHVQFFRFDGSGNYLGTQELTRTIQLVPPDTFTGTTTFELFAVDGVTPVGSGCATEISTRFE